MSSPFEEWNSLKERIKIGYGDSPIGGQLRLLKHLDKKRKKLKNEFTFPQFLNCCLCSSDFTFARVETSKDLLYHIEQFHFSQLSHKPYVTIISAI